MIVETDRGILLVSHSRGRRPVYMLPGGSIRRGEKPIKAAKRELREETGLYTTKIKYLFDVHTKHNRHIVFLVKTSGKPRKRHETTRIRYYNEPTKSRYSLSSHVEKIVDRYIVEKRKNISEKHSVSVSGVCAGCEGKFDKLYKKGDLYYCHVCVKTAKIGRKTQQKHRRPGRRRPKYSRPRLSTRRAPKKLGVSELIKYTVVWGLGILVIIFGMIRLQQNPNSLSEGIIPETIKSLIYGLDINPSELEKNIHLLVNEERSKFGVPPLQYDDKLAKIARLHSKDMATNNYFSHTNLVGDGPTDRAIKWGYSVHKELGGGRYSEGIGENIFQGWRQHGTVIYYIPINFWKSQTRIAEDVVSGWMDSYGHRKNILHTSYSREGIGVSVSGRKIYVTQDFW